jgi:hypothetical protein
MLGSIILMAVLAIGLLIVFIVVERRDKALKATQAKQIQNPSPRFAVSARIEEDVATTPGGNICGFFLVVTILVSAVIFGVAETVFGQIEAGLFLIAGTLLFGLGIVLGRKRTYVVYQVDTASKVVPVTLHGPGV